MSPKKQSNSGDPNEVSDFVAAVLVASRALVGIAARSLTEVESEVTLQQYRALVVLAQHGDQRMSDMSATLAVHPSTMSRLCDRLVAKDLITRCPAPESRREVMVALSPRGRRLVDAVTRRRRREIERIARQMPASTQHELVAALECFGDAAGEVPDQAWKLGWS